MRSVNNVINTFFTEQNVSTDFVSLKKVLSSFIFLPQIFLFNVFTVDCFYIHIELHKQENKGQDIKLLATSI